MLRQERRHVASRAVPQPDPDDFWWEAPEDTQAVEVLVLGDEHIAVRRGVLPHLAVGGTRELDLREVRRARVCVREQADEPR